MSLCFGSASLHHQANCRKGWTVVMDTLARYTNVLWGRGAGMWDAVMVNSAPELLRVYTGQAQTAIDQLRLNNQQTNINRFVRSFYWTDYVSNLSSLCNSGEDSWILTSLPSKMGSRTPMVVWWLNWHHRCVPGQWQSGGMMREWRTIYLLHVKSSTEILLCIYTCFSSDFSTAHQRWGT